MTTPEPAFIARRRRIRTGNRSNRVVIGITDEDLEIAHRRATKAGLTPSSYLYQLLHDALRAPDDTETPPPA